MKPKTSACSMSQHAAGDEVFSKFEGLLLGTVRRVQFKGCKVRYEVALSLECEVPESAVVGAHEVKGGTDEG